MRIRLIGAATAVVLSTMLGTVRGEPIPVSIPPTLLVVENGILTGAKSVSVNGRAYDVEFVDGTCATAYGQCSISSFTLDYGDALAASEALLNSVFIDSPAGAFDSEPYRIRGCVHSPQNYGYPCIAHTAAYFDDGFIVAALAANQPSPSIYTDRVIGSKVGINDDFTPYVMLTWAVWRPSVVASIPEPQSMVLVLLAMCGLQIARRRGRMKQVN